MLETAPKIRIQNLNGECTPDDLELVHHFYGREGAWAFLRSLKGESLREDEVAPIDNYFFRRIVDMYGLNPKVNPRAFYEYQLESANVVTNKIVRTLLWDRKDILGLKTEVDTIPQSPFERILILGSRREEDGSLTESDPELRFQVKRQLYLAHISAQIDSRKLNGRLEDHLLDIEGVFNESLFKGETGKTSYKEVMAYHDNEINRVLRFREDDEVDLTLLQTAHLKSHLFKVRRIEGLGDVFYTRRQKEHISSVEKAIRKAIINGGEIDPMKDVQDSCGIRFVVMGGAQMENDLTRKIPEVLVKDYTQKFPERAIDMIPDDVVDSSGSQNSSVSFSRIQFYFGDLPVPIEIIVQNLSSYLNSEYEIGGFDETRGRYTGQAHTIYEVNRCLDSLSVLFPQEIYTGVNLNSIATRKMHSIARDLREMNMM